jgi:hypothetical protein
VQLVFAYDRGRAVRPRSFPEKWGKNWPGIDFRKTSCPAQTYVLAGSTTLPNILVSFVIPMSCSELYFPAQKLAGHRLSQNVVSCADLGFGGLDNFAQIF